MHALRIDSPGSNAVLQQVDMPVPVAQTGEVLIAVAAAGVNRADILQKKGKYPPPPGVTEIPGLEVAGTIAALGEGVTGWRVGQRVCALLAGGGYAEYAAVDAHVLLPVPEEMPLTHAAALPEALFTAWFNLVMHGKLVAGEHVLIHAGSSGVGTMAIQLAILLGARVSVTAGGEEKCARCLALGATAAIDYTRTDAVQALEAAAQVQKIDVVLDMIGGEWVAPTLGIMNAGGRYVVLSLLQGAHVALNLAPLLVKNLRLQGSTLRGQPLAVKAAIADGIRARVWPFIATAPAPGRVGPVMDGIIPWLEAESGLARMEKRFHFGKIVLSIADS